MTTSKLMEQGIRAYTSGQLGEAERCWRDVLASEPQNERARSYLELLVDKLAGGAAPAGSAAPVPLPTPAVAPSRGPREPARQSRPVPLPAPAQAAWLQPPVQPTTGPFAPSPAERPPVLVPSEAKTAPGAARPKANSEGTFPSPTPGLPLTSIGDALSAAASGSAAPAAPQARPGSAERMTPGDPAQSPWDQGPASAPAVVLGEGVGLDLASVAEQSGLRALVPEESGQGRPKRPRSDVEIWLDGARELFALGDFSGSLEMIEKILKIDPSHAEAREYLKQNEATLTAMYESKIGSLQAIPTLAIQPEEVMWLNLDHRAGFLLAQIDGAVSYDDLFALSGLPRLDTARILATLLHEGVIRS